MKAVKVLALATIMALGSGCASFVANNTNGVVGTASGERSFGQIVIDKQIERTAKINMYKLDSRFKQARINIESFHSNVLLTGQVPDAHLRKLLEDNLKAMPDVKVVHNYITVGEQASYSTIVQDMGVTANTKGLISRADVISNSKVLLHTENGVLYVMGRLTNAEIVDLNKVLQNVGNVTKIITLIDNLDTMPKTTAAPHSTQISNIGLGAVTTALPTNAIVHTTPVAIDPNQEQSTTTQP